MKYCIKCGNELFDEAIICPKCGASTQDFADNSTQVQQNSEDVLSDDITFKRKLTIMRRKSFVGSLSTMAVYIEDSSSGIMVSGTPCREIGVLPNGGEQTFMIDEKAAKVFVAPRIGKKYCNDLYKIPAGNEDVYLSGKNKYDLVTNTFRFDNVTDEEALENRRNSIRKGTVTFVISMALVIFFYVLILKR